jgi:hypothetical protein
MTTYLAPGMERYAALETVGIWRGISHQLSVRRRIITESVSSVPECGCPLVLALSICFASLFRA